MIHILDRQTERILDVLVNQSDRKIYWDTKMTEAIENNVLIFEFRMLADSPAAKHIIPKNKLTAQDQDGFHRLFVIDTVEMSHDANGKILFVSALGDHIELASDEPIPPQTLSGQTAETAVQFVLANTRYQPGQIDFAGSRTITFDTYTNPLAALQKIASEFELELRFRVTVNPDGSITRIVDLLKPDSVFDGKEIVFGKDMTGIRRKENTENICTRLVGIGPADEDGNIVTFASVNGGKIYVEDEEAFQRWNNAGRHIWGIFEYQPEDGTEVTPQQLLGATKKEMEKRKNSVVEWEVQAAALEQVIGLEHERVRVGMNVRIKDEAFDPPIYLEARVLETEMPELDDPNGNFSYTFGNYREVKVVVPAEVKAIQKILFHNSGGWSAAKVKADIAQQIANEAKADVEAANARIDNLVAVDITALHAEIENLEAIKANVEDLFSINAQIENLRAEKANITDLEATNARIDDLVANDLAAINASIQNLKAGKADITDLNATNARVGALEADVGSINTLLAGNLGAENFRAGAIYAGSGVIAEGAIGNAEISNLNASKINAGILDTALVTIQGKNGRMRINNNRLQVFANKEDGSLYERVVLGDVNGDGSIYGLRVRGADGQTILLDENGVTREGITDGSITNEKIADDANISGTKLDIASVVTEINEGTTTIQSSKIFYNGKTLDIQLGTMQTTINNQGQTITNHETRITATEQGLATKVSVSQYQQDQAALSSQLSQMSTQIQETVEQIALKANKSDVYTKTQIDGQFTAVNTQISNLSAQLSVQADQIATKVSRTEFESLQIGGRNLIRNSDFSNGSDYWEGQFSLTEEGALLQSTVGVSHIIQSTIEIPEGEYVAQIRYKVIEGQAPYLFATNGTDMTILEGSAYFDIADNDWNTHTVRVRVRSKSRFFAIRYASGSPVDHLEGKTIISWVKLEKGNKATDWTPAPEDFQGQIDGLGSRMTTAETSITQLSNQIQLKANQSTVDNLTGQISSLQAQLTVQADQIATKVSRTEFESLQIGGRNLIKNSGNFKTLGNWKANGPGTSITLTQKDGFPVLEGIKSITGENVYGIKNNTEYVFSAEVMFDRDVNITYSTPLHCQVAISGDVQGGKESVSLISKDTVVKANTWTVISVKIKTKSDVTITHFKPFIYGLADGTKFWVKWWKLEEGNKPTAWTPAPEDVQEQIDGLGSRLSTAETSITQLANQITLKADQSVVNTLTGQVSNIQSQINVMAGQISSKVEKDGVISAINQTAEQIKIQASKVDLSGYVTFTNLSTPGQTTIDGGNLKTGSVTTDKIAAKAITADKLNVTSLDAISADLGTVTAGTLKGVKLEGALIDATTGLTVYHLSISANRYPNLAIYGEPNTGTFTIRTTDGIDSAHSTSLNIVADGNLRLGGSYGTIETETVLVQSPMDMDGNDIDHVNYLYAKHGWFNGQTIELTDTSLSNIYIRPQSGGSVRFTAAGTTTSFVPIYASNVFTTSVDINTGGTHLYARPSSSGNLKVTAAGTVDVWRPVEAASFENRSLERYKQDIELWNGSALDIIRNSEIYQYRLKTDVQNGIDKLKYGFIIGEGYQTPSEVITPSGESVDIYVQSSVAWKAIQELDSEQMKMKDEIEWLKLENQYLKQKIQQLEGMIA